MHNFILPIKIYDLLLGWQYTKIWGSEGSRLVHESIGLAILWSSNTHAVEKILAVGFNDHAAVYLST